MRYVPTILLVLSFPAGILGYTLGVRVISALPLPAQVQGIALTFVPLLVGGLFMLPLLVPFVDRKARQDLEAHRGSKATPADGSSDRPGGGSHSGPRTSRR